jgi:hypothetical protein
MVALGLSADGAERARLDRLIDEKVSSTAWQRRGRSDIYRIYPMFSLSRMRCGLDGEPIRHAIASVLHLQCARTLPLLIYCF